jgi:hypothetical protein
MYEELHVTDGSAAGSDAYSGQGEAWRAAMREIGLRGPLGADPT